MVKDAESHSEEDKKRREEIDTRNRTDSLTYEVEKNSKEWEDRLAPELKTRLTSAVERARKALRGDDMAEIRSAQEELTSAYQDAGRSLYEQGQAAGAEAPQPGAEQPGEPAGAQPGSEGKEDVVEAEYEIVDDK
jgi:molecular chaperone DnaK